MVKPANDDCPTDAWVKLRGDKETFAEFLVLDRNLTWHLKNPSNILKGRERERMIENIIWFMNFEIAWRRSEIEMARSQIKIVVPTPTAAKRKD